MVEDWPFGCQNVDNWDILGLYRCTYWAYPCETNQAQRLITPVLPAEGT